MRGLLAVLFFLAIAVAMAFLVLPVVAIFSHVPLGPAAAPVHEPGRHRRARSSA